MNTTTTKKTMKRPAQKASTLAAMLAATLLALAAQAQTQTTTSETRTTRVDYDAYGQVLREVVEPGDGTYELVTEYERDAATGVVTGKTLKWRDSASGAAQERRIESRGYDDRKRFALSVGNALGQAESRTYDSGHGQALSRRDANGLLTTWSHDAWGRVLREERPDGTASSTAYRQCVDSCGSAVSVRITQHWAGTSQTAVPEEAFGDRLGRSVQVRSWGFDGAPVIEEEKAYDSRGYTERVARPRRQGEAVVWTLYERDAIGRVERIRHPNAAGNGHDTSSYAYRGLMLTSTNAKGQQRVLVRNALGKPGTVTDTLGRSTRYLYDPWGSLGRSTDPKGNRIEITYDRLGRKTKLTDPDLGTWTYSVDPLGQTWRQQDAKGQLTTYSFDALGRQTRRLEPDQDSRWEYDSAAHGVGRLAEAYTVVNGQKDAQRIHSYDALGRPLAVRTRSDWDYESEYGYDGFGRQNRQSHRRQAKGGAGAAAGVALSQDYNAYGYQDRLYRHSADGSAVLLWQALRQDAEGRIVQEQYAGGLATQRSHNAHTGRLEAVASGSLAGGTVSPSHQDDTYRYDALGNLTYRAQMSGSGGLLQEGFDYDALNRLQSATVNGATDTATYDEVGSLQSKSHVGSYSYPPSGAGSVRPHAVSGIAGTVAGLANPQFSYDANGSMTSGLNRSYTWMAGGQPATIDKLGGGTAVQRTAFVYGADHERLRQTVSPVSAGSVGTATTTIHYAGAIEKEEDTAANTTTIRTSLPGGLGYVEEKIPGTAVAPTAAGVQNARFFLKDHLGSATAIVDEARQVLQRLSYDAWGRRRNPDGTADSWSSLGTIANNQDNSGYTGHETLDQLGLVHMNARLYDPITGRHVSADPTVPDPGDAQAFNRYSYVLNNALAFVDPTGLTPWPMFRTLSHPRLGTDAADQERCQNGAKCDDSFALSPDGQVQMQQVDCAKSGGESCAKSSEGSPEGTFNGIKAGAAALAGYVGNAVDTVVTGGYGQRTDQAVANGEYGMAAAYTVAGVAYGLGNAASLGTGAAVNALRTMGSEMAAMAGSISLRAESLFASKLALRGECFTEGTPVHTAAGLTPIEDIREGDFVAARDERTGETSWRPVMRLFRNAGKETVRVSYMDGQGEEETLGASLEHPFRVAGRGWVGAGELKPGDRIVRRDGGSLTVKQVVRDPVRRDTFNFEVAGVHTYFVGGLGAWVHNASVIGDALSKGVQAGEAGSYASLNARRVTGDGLTPHHMPQAGAGRTGYDEGGALVMSHTEHMATRTWGPRGIQTLQQDIGLTFREVLSKDIRDVRQIVGPKYNEGLRDLINYYRRSFPDLMKK